MELPWPPAAPGFRTLPATAVPKPYEIFGENIASMMLMTTAIASSLVGLTPEKWNH